MEASSTAAPAVQAPDESLNTGRIKVFLTVLVVTAIAELIGTARLKIGPGYVILQPMLWALLIAAAWGLAANYMPSFARINTRLQGYAGALLNAALLLFIIKLGFTVGGALPHVKEAGWALLFQELGHAFGTLILGLPLALLLGIKREAVGATFSIGREGNLVIVGEKYGMASPEGRGVLAEYITGTVLGALFIALLAGFVTSLGIFDPRSLAMGAGVGSGSMMAAAIGSITAQYPASMTQQLTAIAAAANLVTAILGFYVTLFASLPVCSWLYYKLEPVLGRFSKNRSPEAPTLVDAGAVEGPHRLAPVDVAVAWAIMVCGVTIGNFLTYKVAPVDSLIGLSAVVAVAILVQIIVTFVPKIPHVLVLSVVATVIGIPNLLPFSNWVVSVTDKLNFLAFTTPVLALAGFSVAKDLPIFRQLGWRIVVVSLTAAAGTFLGATLVAEFFH